MVDRNSTISVVSRLVEPSIGNGRRLGLNIAKIERLAVALVCLAPLGSPVHAATVTAAVIANGVKPLVLTKIQDLDLGSVTLGSGAWSNATVSLSQAGVLSCANANITCTGAATVATYNVQGSKQNTVNITVPNVTMVNQSASSPTLTLATSAPPTLVPANS